MHVRPRLLLNTPDVELWPAWLLRARGNADARALAQAEWLRDKGVAGGEVARRTGYRSPSALTAAWRRSTLR